MTQPPAHATAPLPMPDLAMPRRLRLAAIVIYALPLLLLFLGSVHATDMMELFNLVPVREAVQDGHWLMPTLNGVPRFEKPPLPVWVPGGLAWICGTMSLWVLRLPSILLAVSACVATALIGRRLSRDRLLGTVAGLSLAGTMLFIRNARLATYDIYAASFCTWMLLGLVALCESPPERPTTAHSWNRPLEKPPALPADLLRADADTPLHPPAEPGAFANAGSLTPRARFGWILLTGVAAGLSILSKGPVPAATVALPVGLWMLLFHRRPRVYVDVFLAAIVAVAVAAPWLIVIGDRYRDAWPMWLGEFVQFATSKPNNAGSVAAQLKDPWYYYIQFLYWMMPFTPLFVGGLLVPLLPAHSAPKPDARERRGRWLFWLVVVLGLVLLSVPSEKKPRYALQIMPAAALLVAVVWQEFARLDPRRPFEPAARVLLFCNEFLWIIVGMLLVLAALIAGPLAPAYGHLLQGRSGALGHLSGLPKAITPAIQALTWPGALFIGSTLVGFGLWLQRAQNHRAFRRAAAIYLLAAWLFNLAVVVGYYGTPYYHRDLYASDCQRMIKLADGRPIYTLDYRPWLPVLWDAGQILPETTPAGLQAAARAAPDQRLYVVVPVAGDDEQTLAAFGTATHRAWQPRIVFNDGHMFIQLIVVEPTGNVHP